MPSPSVNATPRREAHREGALCHQHRMQILDGYHPTGDLDRVDLMQRDRQNREKVWLVRQLAHPYPFEAFVAQHREVGDRRIDRRIAARSAELPEHADLHYPSMHLADSFVVIFTSVRSSPRVRALVTGSPELHRQMTTFNCLLRPATVHAAAPRAVQRGKVSQRR
jgi:hypothetical protein